MNFLQRRLLFDRDDYRLLASMADNAESRQFAPELHPRGILELSEPQALRILRYTGKLIDVLDSSQEAVDRRLGALQALRDELMEGLNVPMTYNTARAVLQIAKELLRCGEDPLRRLRLAHDLRSALLGNPLFIRKVLRRYRLIEMPEDWIPVTFDQHVHDANTKGRKSPSHLLLDAWIKGIVKIQVVYYNFVPPEAAEELLRAAAILKIDVRIGVEFRSVFRGRFVELIWAPRGFSGAADYLKFLRRPKTEEFTQKCMKAADFRRRMVLQLLEDFNRRGRLTLNHDYQVELDPIPERAFLASIRYGQPSLEHIGALLLQELRSELNRELKHAKKKREREIRTHLEAANEDLLLVKYLDLAQWELPPDKQKEMPEINRWSPEELCNELHKVASGFRMTLNLSHLQLEDVIEILYDCRGDITTLEIFNLKDSISAPRIDDGVINQLRHALNAGNVVQLKNLIRQAINRLKVANPPDRDHRLDKLNRILHDLPAFFSFYTRAPLSVSLGSDSTGRPSPRGSHGMGFVVIDSLGNNVRRQFRLGRLPEQFRLPIYSEVYRTLSYLPRRLRGAWGQIRSRFGFGHTVKVDFVCPDPAREVGIPEADGNLASLGRFFLPGQGMMLLRPAESAGELWHYFNSNFKIVLKILAGFLAAFLTFRVTASWWVLVYFGAVIWLGVTAIRNIIQSVAAGGGFRNSRLRKWNDFISWQRVADSLFYTGLSVPLLELVVKQMILQNGLGLTAEKNPLLVFSGIALANGFYISGHNLLRAFPKSAVWGNWLRAPLSIPLALFYHSLFHGLLLAIGVPGVESILQQWATILSKLASDTIGGIIEATADRSRNLAARYSDFRTKIRELFILTSEVELLVPDKTLQDLLRNKQSVARISGLKRTDLLTRFSVNALDCLYIRMRQPQAAAALKEVMAHLSDEERLLFVKTQEVLLREKAISKLFLNNLVGPNFSKALAFYLHGHADYLKEIARFTPGEHTSSDWYSRLKNVFENPN